MNTNTPSIGILLAMSIISMLAFSGCSQKATMAEEKTQERTAAPAPATKHVAGRHAESSTRVADMSTDAPMPPPPPQRIICDYCGVVVSVKAIEQEGKGSGLGVVAGGLTGGLLGNQVGNGTGRDLATIAGAIGGAFAGNTVEKKIKKTTVYDVTVEMDNGEKRVLRYKTAPGVMEGDKIKVEGEKLVRQ